MLDRSEAAVDAATELARRESRCCSWGTFAVELPPGGESVVWRARSDGGPEAFEAAFRELLDRSGG